MVPDILLATLNAKYIHAAFGLRYLLANLGDLRTRAEIREFEISQRPIDVVENLLRERPRIIGLGVYIWNVTQTTEVVCLLKRLAPDVSIVLGGPEVSYETEGQAVVALADYVIAGEADLAFPELCCQLLNGQVPGQKIIRPPVPEFSRLVLPYDLYSADDIAHRIIYVEASRGCPFKCEFCLSSLDIPVRQSPLKSSPLARRESGAGQGFLEHLDGLISRGARHLKFVDRTFNLNVGVSLEILGFLLERWQPGMLFHFEMVPDRLPTELREMICKFPAGSIQLEVGVQTFNPEVGGLIERRQDYGRLRENLAFLRSRTHAHIHADLIAGLPGESLESFGSGFDQLIALQPHEIQVGILKRLRGTTLSRHDAAFGMIYNPHPPYEILENRLINFPLMQRVKRFARYWDLVGNSGNFVETTPLLWSGQSSPFAAFMKWSDWLYAKTRRTDSIALARLMELIFEYLRQEVGVEPTVAARALWIDYKRGGRQDKPSLLKDFLLDEGPEPHRGHAGSLKRQARHG
jgi:radical SAM superfamily enzyme YgiQ (UPF0313 family)